MTTNGRPSGEPGAQGRRQPPLPRWVLAFLVVAAALLLFALVSALLGVEHGPGMHVGEPQVLSHGGWVAEA